MKIKPVTALCLGMFAFESAPAQSPSPAVDSVAVAKEEAIQLPAFQIKSEKDDAFVGKTALSSTRIAVDLMDLPQSVKVLNQSFLQAINPSVLTETLNYVGGAQMGNQVISPGRVTIRGFAGDGDYVDGFAPPASSAPESQLFERFEVIKGPSVIFLSADGSPGGIVNKITKSPRSKQETTVTLQVGRFDANNASIDTTGAVTKDGKLLYRLVAAQQYSNGYYDYSWLHRFTLMPALSYQFSPTTKLEIKGLFNQAPNGVYQGMPIDQRTLQPFAVAATRNPAEDTPYNWRHDLQKRGWLNFTSRLSDAIAFRLGGMAASSVHTRVVSAAATWTEARSVWAIPAYNGTQSFPRTTNADYTGSIYRDLQSDLNFNFRTGPVNHNFLVGGEMRVSPAHVTTFQSSSSAWNPFVYTTPTVMVNYNNITQSQSTESASRRLFFLETAKFFQDRLLLSFGLSRSRESDQGKNLLTGAYTTVPYSLYKTVKQWGAVYKLAPTFSVFVGHNENFSLNGVGIRNGVSGALPPKQGAQTEGGIKADFLNRKLSVNVTYFDVNQTNNTVASFPLDPANPRVLIPGVVSRGFDGDLSYQLGRNVYFMGSFSWYKAKSVLGPGASAFVQPYYGRVVTGSIPVTNASEHTASLYSLYKFNEGKLKGLNAGLGAIYQSKRAITDGANQVMFGFVPGRTVFNASLNYRTNVHWRYSLNVDNLLNAHYTLAIRSANLMIPASPTNFKLSAAYTF